MPAEEVRVYERKDDLADVVVGGKVTRTSCGAAVEILDVTGTTRTEVRTEDGKRWKRARGNLVGGYWTVRPYQEGDERAVEVSRLRTAYETAGREIETINRRVTAYEADIAGLERTIEKQRAQLVQAIEAREVLRRAEVDALAALAAAGGKP